MHIFLFLSVSRCVDMVALKHNRFVNSVILPRHAMSWFWNTPYADKQNIATSPMTMRLSHIKYKTSADNLYFDFFHVSL